MFAVLVVFVWQADLVAAALCGSFVVFVAESGVLYHPRGTEFGGLVVYCSYSVEHVDVFRNIAKL